MKVSYFILFELFPDIPLSNVFVNSRAHFLQDILLLQINLVLHFALRKIALAGAVGSTVTLLILSSMVIAIAIVI